MIIHDKSKSCWICYQVIDHALIDFMEKSQKSLDFGIVPPEEVIFPVQYGQRITSLAVYLHDYQLVPYDRCCELLSDVFGCEISPSTLIKAENTCFEKLEPFETEIKKLLSQSPVVHFDETGSRVNGQRYWLHVASTSQMTYYMIHAKRGSIAMDAMAILPGFT